MWLSVRRALAAVAISQATFCLALLPRLPPYTKEIAQQSKNPVNAVYFTNWFVEHPPRPKASTDMIQGHLWKELPASRSSSLRDHASAVCLLERQA